MKTKARGGFTLIEMMVVIVIILILSGIVLKVATLASRQGGTSLAEAELQKLANALSAYCAEYGHYPPGTGDPAKNTQYEYECAPSQTPWFRDTWLPQHSHTNLPAQFFPDIIPPAGTKSSPYDRIPQQHNKWGLACHYGLIAHLWPRENPLHLDLSDIPGAAELGLDPNMPMQQHWYDADTDRDLAAKTRWAPMLEGIPFNRNGAIPFSAERRSPTEQGVPSAQWLNSLARLLDPWARDYRYICRPPYLGYELWSAGPDGVDGNADDIRVTN
jgi:prepilin-type N-terminal cleavage/methylation domain-containing protein